MERGSSILAAMMPCMDVTMCSDVNRSTKALKAVMTLGSFKPDNEAIARERDRVYGREPLMSHTAVKVVRKHGSSSLA